MSRALHRLPVALRVAAGALAVLLVAIAAVAALRGRGEGSVRVTAELPRAVGLYAGSDVRVLGVKVGEVRSVTPVGTTVRVELEYAAKHAVPADAKAAVVAPSVVSDRYVQLFPAYRGGPKLQSGDVIGLDRTAVPVEIDRIYSSLNDLNVALGPQGANSEGALSRLLAVGRDNLAGNGGAINATTRDFSAAVTTLADGRDDLFGTVRNLQVFTTALARSDAAVRAFNTDLASVADHLAAERDDLAAAMKNLAVALTEVASFVRDNRASLTANISGLAEVSQVLVKQRAALAEVLEAGPAALSNLQLAYNPSSGTLDTRNNAEQFQDPALFLCSLLRSVGAPPSSCAGLSQLLRAPAPASGRPAPGRGDRAPDRTLGGLLAVPR